MAAAQPRMDGVPRARADAHLARTPAHTPQLAGGPSNLPCSTPPLHPLRSLPRAWLPPSWSTLPNTATCPRRDARRRPCPRLAPSFRVPGPAAFVARPPAPYAYSSALALACVVPFTPGSRAGGRRSGVHAHAAGGMGGLTARPPALPGQVARLCRVRTGRRLLRAPCGAGCYSGERAWAPGSSPQLACVPLAAE